MPFRRRWGNRKSASADQLTLDLRNMTDAEREEALRTHLGGSKPNKMGAKTVVEDGIEFKSHTERDRYLELKFKQDCGLITDLQVHKPIFVLQDKFRDRYGAAVREIKYTPDFSYVEDGLQVIEEVKGADRSIYPEFNLRIKLLKKRYPDVDIWIVHMQYDRHSRTWFFKDRIRA